MSDYTGPFDGVRPNGQVVEKRLRGYRGLVDVHSMFHTIQGEGPFCGTPSVFVRLAGCNLVCPFCDTEYTEGRKDMTPQQILDQIRVWRQDGLIVITGGEPFRQPHGVRDLVTLLVSEGYYVQIESNGTLPPSELSFQWNKNIMDRKGAYIVCSPKSGIVNPATWRHACCAKYVGTAGDLCDDGLPRQALGHPVKDRLARPPEGFDAPIYLQPVDHQDPVKNEANLKEVVASCMEHGYIVQIQIHKLLEME